MRPLRRQKDFAVDPLTGIMGALANLRKNEVAILQVLFQAVRYPWAESIMRAVTDHEGGPFFADAPDMLPLAKEKVSRPLVAVVVRAAAKSPGKERAWKLVRALGSAFTPLADPTSNQLIALAHQDIRQLWDENRGVASAVITNPCTRICFRVGDFDAKQLKDGVSSFDAKDLQSLGVGEALCRIERAEYDFNLKTSAPPAVEPDVAQERREKITARSRQKYGRSREEVESIIAAARGVAPAADEVPKGRRASAAAKRAEVLEAVPQEEETPAALPRVEVEAEPAPVRLSKERLKPASPEPPLLGRGGREHKYLQHLVKRLAEDRDYRAVIEQPILDGVGKVDVSLEKGERKIACEISVTSTTEYELGNIQKCLAAGYETVVLLSSEAKVLRKQQAAAEGALEPETLKRVRFLQPEDFITYLDELAAGEASGEETLRGYRVKTRYRPVGEAEARARRQAISQVLLHGRKRVKDRGA